MANVVMTTRERERERVGLSLLKKADCQLQEGRRSGKVRIERKRRDRSNSGCKDETDGGGD
jgi:hypothetical protein